MECPRNVTVCTDSGPYDMVRQVVLPTHTRRPPLSPPLTPIPFSKNLCQNAGFGERRSAKLLLQNKSVHCMPVWVCQCAGVRKVKVEPH